MKKHSERLPFTLVVALLFMVLFPFPSAKADENSFISLDKAEVKVKATASSEWELSKQVLGEPYFGEGEVVYELAFSSSPINSNLDRVDLQEVIFTDYLSPGATFVRASCGGEYDPDTHTVKWINPEGITKDNTNFSTDHPHRLTVTVKYPQANKITKVVNRSSAEYTPLGAMESIIVEAQILHGFTVKPQS